MDPELFSVPEGDRRVAREVCITACTVREQCLRDALHTAKGRGGGRGEMGVIRGGIVFNDRWLENCRLCGLACADTYWAICRPCRLYRACDTGCGRRIRRSLDKTRCDVCEHDVRVITIIKQDLQEEEAA